VRPTEGVVRKSPRLSFGKLWRRQVGESAKEEVGFLHRILTPFFLWKNRANCTREPGSLNVLVLYHCTSCAVC